MDVAGAAVATMISNAISMVYFFFVLAKIRNTTILTLAPRHFSLEKQVAWGTCGCWISSRYFSLARFRLHFAFEWTVVKP